MPLKTLRFAKLTVQLAPEDSLGCA